MKKHSKGFTLIELLVVISIISLLSSIVLTTLNGAKAKARDARRMADIHEIQNALMLYYNDHGHYPINDSSCVWCGGWAVSSDSGLNANTTTTWPKLETMLSAYLPKLPVDPVNSLNNVAPWNGGYAYAYVYSQRGGSDNPQDYDLVANFENGGNQYRCGVKNYQYHNETTGDIPFCTAFGGFGSNQIYADH